MPTRSHRLPNDYEPEDDLVAFFRQHNISIFDSAAIALGIRELEQQLNDIRHAHVYWDQIHFLSPVYAGLNQVLLHSICDDDDGSEGVL